MESEISIEGAEVDTHVIEAGDVVDDKVPDTTGEETGPEGEEVTVVEEDKGGDAGEGAEGGETAGTEEEGGEDVEDEGLEGEEHVQGKPLDGDAVEGEHIEGEQVEGEIKKNVEGEELMGEELEGEQLEGEEKKEAAEKQLPPPPEDVVEEEEYLPEPPPDPAAPYGFTDSKEALKAPFELRPDQLAEVEHLWELYQNHTPVYSDLDGYITEKELVYMLKSLLLMTYTEEQLQELIAFCCRPPHAKGHIFYEQFLKMVTMRQRDLPIEEEIRSALQFYDSDKQGLLDREYMRDVLTKQGQKMIPKLVDNLIKEVDMANDGTIGIEDIVGTMCIDLNQEDMQLLRAAVFPPKEGEGPETVLGGEDY